MLPAAWDHPGTWTRCPRGMSVWEGAGPGVGLFAGGWTPFSRAVLLCRKWREPRTPTLQGVWLRVT